MFSAAVFVKDSDVAAFAISAIEDPRTLNEVLYLRPPGNVASMNELAEMWEAKIGKKLEKVYVSEYQLLESIQGSWKSAGITRLIHKLQQLFLYYWGYITNTH